MQTMGFAILQKKSTRSNYLCQFGSSVFFLRNILLVHIGSSKVSLLSMKPNLKLFIKEPLTDESRKSNDEDKKSLCFLMYNYLLH